MGNSCLPNEASNVDIDECGHEVLAVKSVHYASMTWDGVCKILKGGNTADKLKTTTDVTD